MDDTRVADLRPYRAGDDEALMEVCLRTGAAGEDATDLFRLEPRLLSEIYLLPYLALAPELATVVAPPAGQPVGYVLGALDTAAFEAAAEAEWWPALRERYPLDAFPAGCPETALVRRIHNPPATPADLVAEYPSHLHVDLLPVIGDAIFIAVRDHESLALEVSFARHRPLDDHADPLAEHLRGHAEGAHRDALVAVGDLEGEVGGLGVVLHGALDHLAAETDGGADGLVARLAKLGGTPVVDEVLPEPTDGDQGEGRAGHGQGDHREDARLLFRCAHGSLDSFSPRSATARRIPKAVSTVKVIP